MWVKGAWMWGRPKRTGADSLPGTLNLPAFTWREVEAQRSAILQILNYGMGYATDEARLAVGKRYSTAAQ